MTDFDPIAAAYDALVNEEKRWAREQPLLKRLLEEAGEGKRRVLDLGCGTGFHAVRLARELDAEVTATDSSKAMLEAAREKPGADAVDWAAADASQTPAKEFDLILLLGNTLSLIADVESVFESASLVAAPDAIFIVQQLDYDVLRERGEQRTEKKTGNLSIVKTLTPLKEGKWGARLHLEVYNADGELIGETDDKQREHKSKQLVKIAKSAGWTLIEERKSYEDADEGSDRIHIFQLQAL